MKPDFFSDSIKNKELFLFFLIASNHFINSSLIKEMMLWNMITLSIKNHIHPFDCLLKFYILSCCPCKLLSYMEILRKESLNFSSSIYRQLILLRQFLHTKNRDNINQFLVPLKNLLHLFSSLHMQFSYCISR